MKNLFVFCVLLVCLTVLKDVSGQAAAPNPFSREQLRCIAACPRVTNYNPICGTDGFQYENMGHLNCARGCNHNVEAVHGGRCQPFLSLPTNNKNKFQG